MVKRDWSGDWPGQSAAGNEALKKRKLIKRLILREYLPWIGLLLGWVMIAFALGIENASNVAAALFLVQAARTLTLARLGRLLRPAPGFGSPAPHRLLAWTVAMAGLIICAGLVAATTAALASADRLAMAEMLPLIAIGLPVRYFLPFTRPSRNGVPRFRIALAVGGLLLLGCALALETGFQGAALALALREWLALAFLLLGQGGSAPRAERQDASPDAGNGEASAWASFVEANHAHSRRRLATRALKSVLGSTLGPLAGIISRTGRGLKLDRRIAQFVPENAWALSVASLLLAIGGASTILLGSSGWTALLGSTLLRLGSATAAPALWSRLEK